MTRQRTLVAVVLAVIAAAALVALGRATAPTPATPRGYADGFLAGRAEGVQEGQAIAESAGSPPASRDRVRAAFDDGYRAGANSAFSGYDGGWSVGRPYVIVLAKGANVNARNNDGESPIFTTVDDEAIPLFIEHGADLSIRNNKGEDVVQAAREKGPARQEALRKALEKFVQKQ